MDIGRAFSYVFEDRSWIGKVVIGGIINVIPIVQFASSGYIIEQIDNNSRGEYTPLIEWEDFGKKFMDGLIMMLGVLVWSLVGIFFLFLSVIPAVISSEAGYNTGIPFIAILGSLIAVLWFMLVGFVYPAILMNFSKKRNFASCFEFSNIFSYISADLGSYLTGIVVIIAAAVLAGFVASIPLIGWIVSIFATFYLQLVIAGAFGQILEKLEGPQPTVTEETSE